MRIVAFVIGKYGGIRELNLTDEWRNSIFDDFDSFVKVLAAGIFKGSDDAMYIDVYVYCSKSPEDIDEHKYRIWRCSFCGGSIEDKCSVRTLK